MKPLSTTVEQFTESIFSTMTKMALENRAINLSQGFPDFDGPKWVIDLATKAMNENKNQYAPSMGILPLREAIANNYKRFYNFTVNPLSEVVVTNGATEAIFCTCLGLLNPGDEVVVLEPFYDSYMASIKLSGAKVVPVTLKAPSFNFDIAELKSAISSKTKLLILNNPHNPTGKVFSNEEIETIGALAREHDFYILSDEVYEFLTFGVDHRPTATFGDLKDRTITISSTGKTFGLTGWKIGWAIGPAHIIKVIHNVHQFSTFCVSQPFQWAMAEALVKMDDYLVEFKADYLRKKNILINGLKERGFNVLNPAGTYFVMAMLPEGENDIDFCKKLIVEKKVATIPTSAFYIKSDEGSRMIRFCFAKQDETLLNALKNLN
ncbi:MAG: aminotransferase class I/II-fold pyridoxal phosphate-dependent enzyme [Bdellovibrionales bacterium]|nr:aminotransferase class I/II-fold pyridoxal phosphate-dependent enzyme [Bdellovibrionales bacterium]